MKKNLIAQFLTGMALAALPLAGSAADELKYTYVEAAYVDLDHGASGAAVRGSAQIGNSGAYVTGNYAWLDADTPTGDVNLRAHEIGVGYHHGIGAKADLIGEVAYRSAETAGARIDGARASVGVRGALGKRGEAFVKGNYYDASDFHGEATGTVGGQFKFNETWGLTGEVEAGNGDKAWLAGVRATFK